MSKQMTEGKTYAGTVLQINSVSNWGSTGRIAEDIGAVAMKHGWRSIIAYGQKANQGKSETYRIGNDWDIGWHVLMTRLFDRHGLESRKATLRLTDMIRLWKPDIIHLHNVHGYYVNYPLLFKFLKEYGCPVVWTLHDCWSFTGHCAYFELAGCYRWKDHCYGCPNRKLYPASWVFDRSTANFWEKKLWFTLPDNMVLVPVSDWLGNYLRQSFMGEYSVNRIYNGIDTGSFCPKEGAAGRVRSRYNISGKHIVLGVASIWEERKGLADFYDLRGKLTDDYSIVLVGLTDRQIAQLPSGITGIARTDGIGELADIYSAADVLFNPTMEDTLPTVNLESQSCGTPVVTYHTGGAPETIEDGVTGYVVGQRDVGSAVTYINKVCGEGKSRYANHCRDRILSYFRKEQRYEDYFSLYERLTGR